ncbi:MAG: hypothetical protein ACRDYF_16580 [Acidimicrobiia bacterium]
MNVKLRVATLAATMLFGSIPAVAGASPSPLNAPLLWRGQVVDASGNPTAATVSAVLAPPPGVIPQRDQVAAGRIALGSIPLSSAVAGRDGKFELRSGLPLVPPSFAPGGFMNVMLFIESNDGGWAVAMDSVRFVGPGPGAWISKLSSESLAPRVPSDDTEGERPTVVTLQPPVGPAEQERRAAGVLAVNSNGPGAPYTGCTALYREGTANAFRTVADIDMSNDWSFRIEYQDTRTTSWDVGYDGGGKGWTVGGTHSFAQTSSKGFNAEIGPFPEQYYQESYQVDLEHAKVLWRCAKKTSPGPFYVRTVQPERWTNSTYNQGDPHVICPRLENRRSVGVGTFAWRDAGTVSQWSASGGAFGFRGGAGVGYTKHIRLGWRNHNRDPRFLCGESGDPFKDPTRVIALMDTSGAPA